MVTAAVLAGAVVALAPAVVTVTSVAAVVELEEPPHPASPAAARIAAIIHIEGMRRNLAPVSEMTYATGMRHPWRPSVFGIYTGRRRWRPQSATGAGGEQYVSPVATDPQSGSAAPAPDGPKQPPRGIPLKLLLPLMLVLGIAGGSSFVLLRGSPKPTLPAGARQSAPGEGFDGTLALPSKTAPPIQLRNYLGQPVSLDQYRGKAVLVTFLYTNCPDVCPLITSNLRVALNMLGRRAAEVQIIAVSVDPRGDTPAAVAHFLAAHGMTGRMQYLIGSAAALGQTWSAWGVGATRDANQPNLIAHSALVYGITAGGRVKTVYPASFEPSQIAHDVPRLASQ